MSNSVNQLFLAEAILRHEPRSRAEAIGLLARLAAAEPRRDYLVEDTHYARLARELLSRGGAARASALSATSPASALAAPQRPRALTFCDARARRASRVARPLP